MTWQVTDDAGRVHTFQRQPENTKAVESYDAYIASKAHTVDAVPVPHDAGGGAYIYALSDPRTSVVRYIGKSIRPVERACNHYNEPPSNCHRSHWIAELRALGLRPRLLILEAVEGDWREAERGWISWARGLGLPLTNNTDGGDGVCGLPKEARERMAATWRGRKHRPESIERLKAARRLRVTSRETRAKMSASQRGRKITWVAKIADRVAAFTVERAAEIAARLAAGERVKDLALEYGVHRTTISKIKAGSYLHQTVDRQAVANLSTAVRADAGLFA